MYFFQGNPVGLVLRGSRRGKRPFRGFPNFRQTHVGVAYFCGGSEPRSPFMWFRHPFWSWYHFDFGSKGKQMRSTSLPLKGEGVSQGNLPFSRWKGHPGELLIEYSVPLKIILSHGQYWSGLGLGMRSITKRLVEAPR